ncbi:hypothetical protein, partial [Salmonella enterica]|uniref:hypothetical protein n=1 Tax=Salmonella enterica TaxID=28901 RepID=UPI0032989A89
FVLGRGSCGYVGVGVFLWGLEVGVVFGWVSLLGFTGCSSWAGLIFLIFYFVMIFVDLIFEGVFIMLVLILFVLF